MKLTSWKGDSLFISAVLSGDDTSLAARLSANVQPGAPSEVSAAGKKRLILSWNAGHSAANLGGCPDWHCEFTTDRARSNDADAVLLMNEDSGFQRRDSSQYTVYFSQVSPPLLTRARRSHR